MNITDSTKRVVTGKTLGRGSDCATRDDMDSVHVINMRLTLVMVEDMFGIIQGHRDAGVTA